MAGFFLTFEGVEGGGKTTQARLLAEALRERGHTVLVTREPGGTEVGKVLRRLVLEPAGTPLAAEAELLLLLADRAQHVRDVILPGLRDNAVVISDRFLDSTIAYQGYGRGLDVATVENINRLATGGLQPTLTVFLDMSVDEARDRKRTDTLDEFERQESEFHQRVRQGYLAQASANPETWLTVDATLPKITIAEKIWARLHSLL